MRGKGDGITRYVCVVARTECKVVLRWGIGLYLSLFWNIDFVLTIFLCSASLFWLDLVLGQGAVR